MSRMTWCHTLPAALLAAICVSAQASPYEAQVRRTESGMPHIKARTWAGLGYGHGHAQAEDNLCTLADAFVTFRGERARHFGADATPATDSTFGKPKNIDLDFFFRLAASDNVVRQYRDAQPPELQDLIRGFAAGYNRYLRDLRAGAQPRAHRACRAEPWLQAIDEADVYRRLMAVNLAGGLARFVAEIANAQPLADAASSPATERVSAASWQVGGRDGIGSNAIGFGGAATGTAHGLLAGNPHWYWRGPDRFYQAQLTIPGVVNVSGAALLGTPLVLIGFNENLAWSHTVSTARRFGIFELSLAPGAPTSYLHDGKAVPMTAVPITVEARRDDGAIEPVTRTLYRTHHGPVLDLAAHSPAMKWSARRAFAIRDINAENFRIFAGHLRWAQARSLDEFMRIQLEQASVPWVNTIAVARNDRRAWYADIGAIPNVSDELAAACATPFSAAFAQAAPGVPFLDGSRSACEWATDADSAQPGAMGRSKMPRLLREDHVANMNDSAWLANPSQPLLGYPRVVGAQGDVQSLRTRLGHLMVRDRLAGTDGHGRAGASSPAVRRMVLDSRVLSAELLKQPVLSAACGVSSVAVDHDPATGERFEPPRKVDIGPACAVLHRWDDTGRAGARGAHLWDEFWRRASRIPAAELYAAPFDPADPLNTPRGLKQADPRLAQALALAALRVREGGFALDARRGDTLFAKRAGRSIPLFGGCHGAGYFTVMCSERRIEEGGYSMDDDPHGNSYLQVVGFSARGVEAYTLLASAPSDDPVPHAKQLQRYAAQRWLRVRFDEAEIAADSALKVTTLRE